MAIEVTSCRDLDEFEAAFMAIGQYFGMEPTRERTEQFAQNLPVERMLAARDDGATVGGAGSFPFELSVPGGSARCAGVTVVGVYPTHRRRGVLRGLMRAQLDDVRERGEPLAALWASEEGIYGRFGYGLASRAGEMELARERAAYALPLEPRGRVRLIESDAALELLPPIWDAAFERTPGFFRRPSTWWEHRIVADPPERRGGGGPKRFALLELEGEPQAYAIYRHNFSYDQGSPTSRLGVGEAVAASPRAEAELWRFLLDMDWQATVSAQLLPVDHPLFLLLAESRRMKFRVGDGLWVRLVDVGAALSSRSYDADGEVVFDVVDAFCPWNQGRWKLSGGRCEPTEDEPDLRCDVSALGSVYLGGFSFAELERGLRAEELREGGIARADRLFSRTGAGPWCPEIF
jgi:predicted acetyltransferase